MIMYVLKSDIKKLAIMFGRRQEMIEWLIKEKKFNPKAAPKCVDNFLESMRYVLETTGRLPQSNSLGMARLLQKSDL